MTHQILKSRLPEGFDDTVKLHVDEMNLWAERNKIVADELKALGPVKPCPTWAEFKSSKTASNDLSHAVAKWQEEKLSRHAPVKRPIGSQDVEASIVLGKDGKYISDYEVVNDDPTADQILRSKKNVLLNSVTAMEQQEMEKIAPPPGKRRALTIREGDIALSDSQRLQAVMVEIRTAQLPLQDLTVQMLAAKTDADRAAAQAKIKVITDSVAPLQASVADQVVFQAAQRPAADTEFLNQQKQSKAGMDAVTRWAAGVQSDIEDLTESNIDAWKIPPFTGVS